MSLKTFESGELISASDFNNNFTELNTRITNTNTTMSAMNTSFLSTVQNMLSIYQDIETPTNTSGTVTLEDNKIYNFQTGGAVTFSLPSFSGDDVNKYHQILVQAYMPTVGHLDNERLGTNVFFSGVRPGFGVAGYYNIFYEYDRKIGNWVCGACIKGVVS